jgi:hypothetical protein
MGCSWAVDGQNRSAFAGQIYPRHPIKVATKAQSCLFLLSPREHCLER